MQPRGEEIMKKPKRIKSHDHSCEFVRKGCVDSGFNQSYDKWEKYQKIILTEILERIQSTKIVNPSDGGWCLSQMLAVSEVIENIRMEIGIPRTGG